MVRNSIFTSPLRYPGGKSCIFNFMTHFICENDMIGINYAEPYTGGAGLALKLLFNEYVAKIYINDLDPSIYALWKALVNNPDAICKWIEMVDVNVKTWEYYKHIQANYQTVDELELAKSTLFLNRTNVSGIIKGGVIGGINQTGKYKINARFNKDDLINRIKKIQQFSSRIVISNKDGVDFLKTIDRKHSDFFVYLDPPYYKKGSNLYMNYFNDADHDKLSKHVGEMKNKWLVSYDYHDFILKLYKEYHKVRYRLSQNTSNRIGDEIFIFDDKLQFDQSLQYLNGAEILG